MNSPQVDEQCSAIARRLMLTQRRDFGPSRAAAITPAEARLRADQMFETMSLSLLSRPPLPAEEQAMRSFIQEERRQRTPFEDVWKALARGLVSSADFRFLR